MNMDTEQAVLEVEQEPTLRETIEEIVDATEGDSSTPPAKPLGDSTQGTDRSPSPSSTPEPKPTSARPAATPSPVATPAGTTELKAPSQWKPAVREKWNALPREVQEEVLRREGDNLRLIGSVGQKIRFADTVAEHIAPFSERLEQNGASREAFLGDVFQTVKSLSGGNAQEKAEVVANIVQSYGIDVRVLDAVLTGRLSAPPPDPRIVAAQRRAYAAESILAQHTQVLENSTQQKAEVTLENFAADSKNEFFDDVRDMMADLIESGRANTLNEAYTASVWANPETRKILLSRESEQRAASKGRRAELARRASSSVHGTPRSAGVATGGQNLTLRDTIAAAFDAQESA